jgi:DNA methylase
VSPVAKRRRAGPGPVRPHRERLNELSGREWIRFTRSWFVENPPRRSAAERSHPAKFPEGLAEGFVRFFTRPGQWVLDPFAGTGSTLLAARGLGRPSVGVELSERYARLAERRVNSVPEHRSVPAILLTEDARRLAESWRRLGLPFPSLVLTSPPYWDMLQQGRGGVRSVHRRRKEEGLSEAYSSDPRDLGNLTDYRQFLDELLPILSEAGSLLAPERYLVVVLQNLRDPSGAYRRLAWDVAAGLDRPPLEFQGERIWCQDSKPLGIWGYPVTFVPNIHHHYCLIFRRIGPGRTGGGASSEAPRRGPVSRSPARKRGASRRPSAGGAARSARR